MVPVERPKTNKKFASREKIRKWKTGLSTMSARKSEKQAQQEPVIKPRSRI